MDAFEGDGVIRPDVVVMEMRLVEKHLKKSADGEQEEPLVLGMQKKQWRDLPKFMEDGSIRMAFLDTTGQKSERWKIRKQDVILKEITMETKTERDFFRQEIYFSRIKSPFILPVFAMAKNQDHAFIMYPATAENTLYFAIHNDENERVQHENERNEGQLLVYQTRVRIGFQVLRGLIFLHNPKGPLSIIHGDISSSNIVLDGGKNPRITNFGQSSEVETSSNTMKERQCTELNNFAGVLDELLFNVTTDDDSFRKKTADGPELYTYVKNIWPKKEVRTKWKSVAEIAKKDFRDVYDLQTELYNVVKDANAKDVPPLAADQRCASCLVNTTATLKVYGTCQCENLFCSQCLSRSEENPLQCPKIFHHSKNKHAAIHPPIGKNAVCLLIAGHDDTDSSKSDAFVKEMEAVKEILTTRHPHSVKLKKKNMVYMITKNHQDSVREALETKFKEARNILQGVYDSMKDDSGRHVRTEPVFFILYYTGHAMKEDGICMENSSQISIRTSELAEELQQVVDVTVAVAKDIHDRQKNTCDCKDVLNCLTLLSILDCCHAASIKLTTNLRKEELLQGLCKNAGRPKINQISACDEEQFASNLFSGALVQALSGNEHCRINNEPNCRYCKEHAETGRKKQYMQVREDLAAYIQNHVPTEKQRIIWNGFDTVGIPVSYFPLRQKLRFLIEIGAKKELKSIFLSDETHPFESKFENLLPGQFTSVKQILLRQLCIAEEGASYGLRIVTPPAEIACRKHTTTRFNVKVLGRPEPTITCKKASKELLHKKVCCTNDEYTYYFEIKDTLAEHAGIYNVEANSENGKASCDIKLTVIEEPNYGPRIIKAPAELTRREHTTTKFYVKIIGKPKPTVTCKKETKELSPEKVYSTNDEYTYHYEIKDTSAEEAGVYKIQANNENGKASCTIQLTVRAGPRVKKQRTQYHCSVPNCESTFNKRELLDTHLFLHSAKRDFIPSHMKIQCYVRHDKAVDLQKCCYILDNWHDRRQLYASIRQIPELELGFPAFYIDQDERLKPWLQTKFLQLTNDWLEVSTTSHTINEVESIYYWLQLKGTEADSGIDDLQNSAEYESMEKRVLLPVCEKLLGWDEHCAVIRHISSNYYEICILDQNVKSDIENIEKLIKHLEDK